MSTRSIRTSATHAACDVCGRTLLRGEQAEVYLSGGARYSVCELCTSRALHGGWVREGTVPEYEQSSTRLDRRRSLLQRLRGRRDGVGQPEPEPEIYTEPEPYTEPERARERERYTEPERYSESPVAEEPAQPAPVPGWLESNGAGAARPARAREPVSRERRRRAPRRREPSRREPGPAEPGHREPRHVRAVPTSIEHKISSAVSLFNGSEYPGTVASITRSLGLPEVSVQPSSSLATVVNVVVAWELCWYRYEVDLSDEVPSFRVAAQGYELHELDPTERQLNAAADDRGRLDLTA